MRMKNDGPTPLLTDIFESLDTLQEKKSIVEQECQEYKRVIRAINTLLETNEVGDELTDVESPLNVIDEHCNQPLENKVDRLKQLSPGTVSPSKPELRLVTITAYALRSTIKQSDFVYGVGLFKNVCDWSDQMIRKALKRGVDRHIFTEDESNNKHIYTLAVSDAQDKFAVDKWDSELTDKGFKPTVESDTQTEGPIQPTPWQQTDEQTSPSTVVEPSTPAVQPSSCQQTEAQVTEVLSDQLHEVQIEKKKLTVISVAILTATLLLVAFSMYITTQEQFAGLVTLIVDIAAFLLAISGAYLWMPDSATDQPITTDMD